MLIILPEGYLGLQASSLCKRKYQKMSSEVSEASLMCREVVSVIYEDMISVDEVASHVQNRCELLKICRYRLATRRSTSRCKTYKEESEASEFIP